MNAAARGYKAILVMPDTMTAERINILKAYGAEVVLTPGDEKMPGSIRKAQELAAQIPGSFMPMQFNNSANPDARKYAEEYMQLNPQEGETWGMIRTAMSTVSKYCIVQMQDYLDLGAEARMNFPGTQSDDNWTWRAGEDAFSPALAEKIKTLSRLYGRGMNP